MAEDKKPKITFKKTSVTRSIEENIGYVYYSFVVTPGGKDKPSSFAFGDEFYLESQHKRYVNNEEATGKYIYNLIDGGGEIVFEFSGYITYNYIEGEFVWATEPYNKETGSIKEGEEFDSSIVSSDKTTLITQEIDGDRKWSGNTIPVPDESAGDYWVDGDWIPDMVPDYTNHSPDDPSNYDPETGEWIGPLKPDPDGSGHYDKVWDGPTIDEPDESDPNGYYYYDLLIKYYKTVPSPDYNDSKNWTSAQLPVPEPIEFFPGPKKFIFNGAESGNKWDVSKGINSLITNMTNFQSYGQQWYNYKNRQESMIAAGEVPQWDSPMSAEGVNSIYAYFGGSGGFSKGAAVSASIFTGLSDIINSG